MTDKLDLKEMSNFIANDFPKPKAKSPTFLQLAEMPHYENVISNIYAFFMRPNESHGFGVLFLEALLRTAKINISREELNFHTISVTREEVTAKGNRIDLVIRAGDIALIIENKIYHHAEFNPFEDYWSSVSEGNKIGIILSLHHLEPKHKSFISVTHKSFMHHVSALLPDYFASASPKFLIYLQDFFQDIDSLYPMDNSENLAAVKFFIDNREKFTQLEKIKKQAEEFKIQQIEKVARQLQLISRSTGANSYRYIDLYSQKGVRLSYEILMGDLFSTRSFMIRLCSTGETMNLRKAYELTKGQAVESGLAESNMPHYKNFLYFFEKIYYVENDTGNESKLLLFADVLYATIQQEWTEISNKVLAQLISNKEWY